MRMLNGTDVILNELKNKCNIVVHTLEYMSSLLKSFSGETISGTTGGGGGVGVGVGVGVFSPVVFFLIIY